MDSPLAPFGRNTADLSEQVRNLAAGMGLPLDSTQDIVRRALQGEGAAWDELRTSYGITLPSLAPYLGPALKAYLEAHFGGATTQESAP